MSRVKDDSLPVRTLLRCRPELTISDLPTNAFLKGASMPTEPIDVIIDLLSDEVDFYPVLGEEIPTWFAVDQDTGFCFAVYWVEMPSDLYIQTVKGDEERWEMVEGEGHRQHLTPVPEDGADQIRAFIQRYKHEADSQPEDPATSSMTATELRLVRHAHGLTLGDLAQYLGVAESTIRRWEADTSPVPEKAVDLLHDLDDALVPIIEHLVRTYQQERDAGRTSVPLPLVSAPLPTGDGKTIPAGLWKLAAAHAHLDHSVRFR